jgi:hypothetical protein
MGGALVYNSTHSAVCFAIVSGHAGGGQFSAARYHPFRTCHAFLTALLPRWLSTVDAALAARCLRSAASEDLISRLILRALVRGRLPILLNVACWSITSQDLTEINRLAGRSLWGGGLRQGITPHMLPQALYGVPGGCRGGKVNTVAGIFSFPPLPLHEFWQQERDGQSHDKRAFRRLRIKIVLGRLPSPRCSHIVRRPIVSPSSSAMSISSWNYSSSADGNGWTYQPSSWCLPARQSSHRVCHAGRRG